MNLCLIPASGQINSKYALIFYEAKEVKSRWAGLDTRLGLQMRFDGRWMSEERYYRYGILTKPDAKLGLYQTRKRELPDEEMLALATVQIMLYQSYHPDHSIALLRPEGFDAKLLRKYFDQLKGVTICPKV